MAERVPIAHFADPETAHLAADFLEHQGIDAESFDKSGWRAPAGGVVLVARNQAVLAVSILHRVRRGEFTTVPDDWSFEQADIAERLSKALGAQGGIRISWLHHLPVVLLAAIVVGGMLLIFAVAALR
jgi:hypothetical protein